MILYLIILILIFLVSLITFRLYLSETEYHRLKKNKMVKKRRRKLPKNKKTNKIF